jgi:hypothetical protein
MKNEKWIWMAISLIAVVLWGLTKEPVLWLTVTMGIIMARIALMEESLSEKISSKRESPASDSTASRKPFEMGVDPSPEAGQYNP